MLYIKNLFLPQILSLTSLLALTTSGREITGSPFLFADNIWSTLRNRRETAAGAVDLHSGEFCVDVSTYGLVKFERTPRNKCDTTFEKICEERNQQVTQKNIFFFQKILMQKLI